MKKTLTHEELAATLAYNPETGDLTWLVRRNSHARKIHPGDIAGGVLPNGYLYVGISGRRYLAHRLAWFLVTGSWPSESLDHKDRNPLNNKWDNLRLASQSQQNANQAIRKDNKSGARGVFKLPDGRYWAKITVNGKTHSLKTHKTLDAARSVYQEAFHKFYGDFTALF